VRGSGNFPRYHADSHICKDVDQTYKRGLEAGGTSIRSRRTNFGDRSGGLKAHTGNQWWIATHIEDVSPEEMKRRMTEWKKSRK
jgi:PhnB protein